MNLCDCIFAMVGTVLGVAIIALLLIGQFLIIKDEMKNNKKRG